MSEVPDQIRLSVRHIAFHEGADHAVRVLEASRSQGLYWETLEALLRSQNQWVRNHVVMPEQIAPVIAGVGLDMAQLEVDMNSPEVLRRIEKGGIKSGIHFNITNQAQHLLLSTRQIANLRVQVHQLGGQAVFASCAPC